MGIDKNMLSLKRYLNSQRIRNLRQIHKDSRQSLRISTPYQMELFLEEKFEEIEKVLIIEEMV